MATTHEDYKISRLPNTFYRISKTSHFFGDDTYEHYFYINGNKKNIGKYTYQKRLIYKNFVSLLNRASSIHYTEMTNMLAREKIKKYVVCWIV